MPLRDEDWAWRVPTPPNQMGEEENERERFRDVKKGRKGKGGFKGSRGRKVGGKGITGSWGSPRSVRTRATGPLATGPSPYKEVMDRLMNGTNDEMFEATVDSGRVGTYGWEGELGVAQNTGAETTGGEGGTMGR